MKLPSVPVIELPGGYRWVQHSIEDKAWQAHLVKHPLGIDALRRQKGLPWNNEGWDRISPPAITEATRGQLASDVSSLSYDGKRCAVKEFRAGKSQNPEPECYDCPPNLLSLCRVRFAKEPLSARYSEETLRVVQAIVDARKVGRAQLERRLMLGLSQPGLWSGLVVMTVGRTDRGVPALRISSSDGVRVELRILSAGQVAWRTTYRASVAGPISQFNHVRDAVTGDPRLSLSEDCFVPRDWGNRHGI